MRRLKASTILFAALLVTSSALAEAPETTETEKPVAAETASQPAAADTAVKPVEEPAQPAADTQSRTASRPTRDDICQMIEAAALEGSLPFEFFARLIWQESRFNPQAVSPAGAQGIAQFMPKTAMGRGLHDPFEPVAALQESAEFLRELLQQFGNLGLAAAAYNAGPGRVQSWLKRRASLPRETQNYVQIITGHPAEKWAAAEPPAAERVDTFRCNEMAKLVAERRNGTAIERLARAALERLIHPRGEPAERRSARNGILGKREKFTLAAADELAKPVLPRGRTERIIKITAKADNRPRVQVVQVAMRGAKDQRPEKIAKDMRPEKLAKLEKIAKDVRPGKLAKLEKAAKDVRPGKLAKLEKAVKDARPEKLAKLADQRRAGSEPQRNGSKSEPQRNGSKRVQMAGNLPITKVIAEPSKKNARDHGDMRMKYGLGAGKIRVAANARVGR